MKNQRGSPEKIYQRDKKKDSLEKLQPTYVVVSWLKTFFTLLKNASALLAKLAKIAISEQKTILHEAYWKSSIFDLDFASWYYKKLENL